MAPKTSWHRYGTKLRHCRPVYLNNLFIFIYLSIYLSMMLPRSPAARSKRRALGISPASSDVDDDSAATADNNDDDADTLSELPTSMLSRLRWIHATSRISSSTVSSLLLTNGYCTELVARVRIAAATNQARI